MPGKCQTKWLAVLGLDIPTPALQEIKRPVTGEIARGQASCRLQHIEKFLVITLMPGRKLPPMLLHRESGLQCPMVPNKRLDPPYTSMLWLFLLTSPFRGLVKEATAVPACHGTGFGWNLHNAGPGQDQRLINFGAYPTGYVWPPTDTVRSSIFSASNRWGRTQMGGPLTPKTHL